VAAGSFYEININTEIQAGMENIYPSLSDAQLGGFALNAGRVAAEKAVKKPKKGEGYGD
jgi:hypothetical protein